MSEEDTNSHPRWHPPTCQTEDPSEKATEPSFFTKIEASDSGHSPRHSIRLEYTFVLEWKPPLTIITFADASQQLRPTVDLRRDA
ncbi:hypothetical protein PoB_005043300 [Plakobranchus ocellatus]|uniref:Uncharacterized protein n=1 Tax=Plakobranchus ocellatus TaxID=259542 RepID=A0AAV4BXH6_9GAST|nr:hypothetical protein PoB_005043300 [Plakobranchus ocellatus]